MCNRRFFINCDAWNFRKNGCDGCPGMGGGEMTVMTVKEPESERINRIAKSLSSILGFKKNDINYVFGHQL